MEKSIISLNMEGYLCQFLIGLFGGDNTKPLPISMHNFLGQLLSEQLEPVPEDCIFKPIERKHVLEVEIGWIGTANRKRPNYHYYLPKSKQLIIEKHVMIVFDEILCTFLDGVRKATEVQIKLLIEQFCDRYNIDFATYYETLKKKYYRHQKSLCTCVP